MTLPVTLPFPLGGLLDREAPPGSRFLRAWLLPLGAAGTVRESGDALPFTLIQSYYISDNEHTSYGFYQLDTLADGFTAAEDAARMRHRRVLYLRDFPATEVEVPDWGTATADLVRCVEAPRCEPYGDSKIWRFTARYRVDLRLVTAS